MKKVWGNCERRGVNYCALALSSTAIRSSYPIGLLRVFHNSTSPLSLDACYQRTNSRSLHFISIDIVIGKINNAIIVLARWGKCRNAGLSVVLFPFETTEPIA
jgi:hypothetical protein